MIGLVLVTHGRLAVEFRSALEAGKTCISGIALPRLAVAADSPALPQIIAFLRTTAVGD